MEKAETVFGECHAHMILDGVYFRDAINQHKEGVREDVVRNILSQYRDAGVTYVRDGGDTLKVGLFASRIAPEYGIEYRMPVFAMHRKGRYGAIVGFPYHDLKEASEMMDRAKAEGADFIKIMVSGILDFNEVGKMSCPPLPPEEIKELIKIVHDRHMAVMFHINGTEAMTAAIEAGADSLEHGYYMDNDCLQALAEHPDTVWVPSISPVANQIGSGRFPDEVLSAITKRQQECVRIAVKAGARVAVGSDAGAYLVPHVKGIRDEYGYLRDALIGDMAEDEIDRMLLDNENFIRKRFRRDSL